MTFLKLLKNDMTRKDGELWSPGCSERIRTLFPKEKLKK